MNRDEAMRLVESRLRPSPLEHPGVSARAFGDESGQPVRFYLYRDVLDELVFSSKNGEGPICTAALVGGFGVEEGTGFVEVTGFTGLEWVDSPDLIYETLRPHADSWIRESSGEPMVGLFVASPGCSGRVTEEAARVHFSLFNIPFQPLVMLDPGSEELTVNARAPQGSFFNAAFRVAGDTASMLQQPGREGSAAAADGEE